MSSIVDQPATERSFARTLVLILCINAASGLAVFVLNWMMTEGMSSAQLVSALTTSLVYANCCGTIMALVMPQVGPLCARKPFPLSWVYYLSTLLILSAIGCLVGIV